MKHRRAPSLAASKMQESTGVTTLLTDTNFFMPARSYRQASVPAVLLLVAGLLPVAGCNHGHNADVVATGNGKASMRAEMDKAYAAQLGDAQQQQQQPSHEEGDSLRMKGLERLIDVEIAV